MPKKFLISLLILGLTFYFSVRVFAYDEQTTHPALTDEIIDFYNLSYPDDSVTTEERELIVSGVILEDQPPRWINHFYDPVHNIAWNGENTGWLSEDVVQALRTIGLSTEDPLTSIDWVNNRMMQERYSRYGGDRTWNKGLEYYAEGNPNEAYRTLGYTLHLLEDATVPEHTRNDPHAHALSGATGDYGSPYEEYTKKWTRSTIGSEQTTNILKNSGALPASRLSIEEYITEAAKYSNRYFFTKDTINNLAYEFPKIIRDDGNFGYGIDENGTEFPLAKAKQIKNNLEYVNTYVIEPNDGYILDAYFSRLSRKAVVEGAGAIKLFKEQARKRAADTLVNKEFPNKLVVLDPQFASWFNIPTISLFGELVKAWDATLSFFDSVGGLTLAIFDKFVTTVGPGQTTVGPRSDEAATSTPSQPDRTAETQAPAPVTASPKAQETVATNPEPSNPTSSPAVAGTSTANPEVNSPVIFGGVSGTPAPTGGISVSGGSPSPGDGGATPNDSTSTGELPPSEPPPSEPPATSTLFAIENFAGEFKSDRLEIDFSWSPSLAPTSSPKYLIKLIDNGTSTVVAETTATSASVPVPGYGKTFTYSIEAQDADGNLLSNIPTADVAVPDWFTEIQPAATDESLGSHYSDNWYNLGTDFYGTVYALTLEGGVVGGNNPSVLQDSTVLLQEYLDSNYLTKNREFVISQGQDFTREIKEVMIKNLNIPLQPNKYYRLWTSNGLQNAYVALKGTINPSCDSPCGDAMWNEFISGAAGGQGRTEHVYRFYPFIQAVMQKDFPAQSTPTSPEITSVNFDDIGMRLDVSWASSTDADTTDNLIKYEFNYSTTGELSADGWIEVSGGAKSIALEFPNSYTFGVRAKDDFGNTSAPSVQNWNFPEGFSVYILSNSVSVADQNFVLSGGGNLASVTVFTDGWSSSARFSGGTCTMALYDAENASEAIAQSETSYESTACNGTKTFSFSSAPEILSGHNYFWRFTASTGNPSTDASIKFYGTTVNTAGGLFSNSSIVNARFELTDSGGGTLFKN